MSSSIASTSRYPEFQADPTASLLENFRRLSIENKWSKKSQRYKDERRAYLAEVVETAFLGHFGVTVESLQAWQSLCKTIGVPPRKDREEPVVLGSIRACQEALRGVYVNLVDLVEAAYRGTVVQKTFSSARDLAKYIKRTGKYFPRERAKRNPLLRRFLIVVVA